MNTQKRLLSEWLGKPIDEQTLLDRQTHRQINRYMDGQGHEWEENIGKKLWTNGWTIG